MLRQPVEGARAELAADGGQVGRHAPVGTMGQRREDHEARVLLEPGHLVDGQGGQVGRHLDARAAVVDARGGAQDDRRAVAL